MSSFDHMEWHIENGTECKGYPGRPDAIGNCEEYDKRGPFTDEDAEESGESAELMNAAWRANQEKRR